MELENVLNNVIMSQVFNSVNEVFTFGKYKGQSLLYVYKIDREYIIWCLTNIIGFLLAEKIYSELNLGPNQIQELNNINLNQKELNFSRLVIKTIENKIKYDTLKKLYDDICSDEPQVIMSHGQLAHNLWSTRSWIIKQIVIDSENNLLDYKNLIVQNITKLVKLIDDKYEYKMGPWEDDFAEYKITIFVNKNTNPDSDYDCNIEIRESGASHNLTF